MKQDKILIRKEQTNSRTPNSIIVKEAQNIHTPCIYIKMMLSLEVVHRNYAKYPTLT